MHGGWAITKSHRLPEQTAPVALAPARRLGDPADGSRSLLVTSCPCARNALPTTSLFSQHQYLHAASPLALAKDGPLTLRTSGIEWPPAIGLMRSSTASIIYLRRGHPVGVGLPVDDGYRPDVLTSPVMYHSSSVRILRFRI